MIAAGRLTQRVILQNKSVVRDAMGGETITWLDAATVWAEIRPLRGRDLVAAQQAASEVTARITVRYRTDVRADWRVKHGTDLYDIFAVVDPAARHEVLELECGKGLRHG